MSSPCCLAIDTSTSLTSIALKCSDALFAYEVPQSEGHEHKHDELSSIISDLCREAQISPQEIEACIVGRGPGSFTGLRISLGFLKGFCLNTRPLFLFSTLTAMAEATLLDGCLDAEAISVAIDARRQECFFQRFSLEEGVIQEVGSPQILPNEKALQSLDFETLLVTNMDEALLPHSRRSLPFRVARGLLSLHDKRQAEGGALSAEELSLLEPQYLRSVAARTIKERSGLTGPSYGS